jgi:hypothetical protein
MLYVNVMYLFKTSMNVPVTLVNMTEHVRIVSTVMYVSVNLGIQEYTVKQVQQYEYVVKILLL